MTAASQSSALLELCFWTSALIRLASTANPVPPTGPSAMHVATTSSNRPRNRSLSRGLPWRSFEKVE